MTRRRILLVAASVLVACLGGVPVDTGVRAGVDTLPARLSDREFWRFVSSFSEPNGYFRSDNLLSNEASLQYVVPDLLRTTKPGRVYLGVGPEQNFTYIAALRPAMAFIVDVRRGNLQLHLMYKALFELSADRAEFVSRLFSRKRPPGLGPTSTVEEIFEAYATVDGSETLYRENLQAIERQLRVGHAFDLSADDLAGVEYVYHAFFTFGPGINYRSTGGYGGRFHQTYADLMTASDGQGRARGYLASESGFRFLKNLERRNMLVPIVGNFAGPKAIRAIAAYLRSRGATVSAFYLSNVEQYLRQDGVWSSFCANVATLPLDRTSTFIRAVRRGRHGYGWTVGLNSELGPMAAEVASCGPSS